MRRVQSPTDVQMREAFQANAADLFAYAERRVMPREDAADVLSDAMLIAWRKVDQLPADPQRARMWLFVIVKNTLLNHRRSTDAHDAAVEKLRALVRLRARRDESERVETELRVRAVLATLPAELAELVRLIIGDGFRIDEAAELMRIPASTARSRYARARELLAEALRELVDGDAEAEAVTRK